MAQPPKPKRRSPDEIAASVLGGQPSRPPRKDQLAEYARQQTGVRRSPDEIAQSVLGRLPTPSLSARIGAGAAGVLAAPGAVKRQTVANLMGIGKSEEEKRAIQAAADVFGAAELPKRKSLQPTFATARGVASVPLEIGKYAAVSAIPGAGLPLAMSLGAAEAAGGQAETSVPAMLSRGAGAVGMPRAERALGAVAESPVGRALFDVLAGEALAGGIKGAVGGVRTARQIGNLDKVRVDLGEAAVRGVPRQGPVAPPSLAFPDAFPRQAGQIRGLIPAQTGRPPRPAPDMGPSAVPVPQPESWRNQQQGQVRGLLPSETGRPLRFGAMPEEVPTRDAPALEAPTPEVPTLEAPALEAPAPEVQAPEPVAPKVAVDADDVADRLRAIVYRDNTDAPILGKKATAASKEIDETLASLGDDDLFEVAKRSWDRFARARSGRDTAPQRANFLWSKVQKVFEDRFGASVEDYDQLMRQDKFDESWGRVPPSKVVQQLIESKADKDEIRRTIGELLDEWENLSPEQKRWGPGTRQIWPNVVERLQAIRTRAEMVMESEFKKEPEGATTVNSPYDVSEEVWFSSGQALRAIEAAHNRLAGVSDRAGKGRRKKKAEPQPETMTDASVSFSGEGRSPEQVYDALLAAGDPRGMTDAQLQEIIKEAPQAQAIANSRNLIPQWKRLSLLEELAHHEIKVRQRAPSGETRPGLASAVGLGAGQGLAGAAVGGATAEDEQDAIDRMVLFGMGAAGLGMAGYRGYQALRGSRPLPPPNPRIVTPAMQQVNDTIFRGGQRTGTTLLQQVKSWPPRAVKALKDFRTGWIDETRPLARAAREAGGEAGMRQVQGRIAEAHGALASARQVLQDRLGPVLKGMSDDELQATGVLLKARREGDLRAIYGPRKADVDDAAIQQAIVDAEAQPRVKAAADEVNKMFADLLEMRHQAGLLTDEAYFRIVNSETAYVAYIKEIAAAIATGGPMGKLAGSQGGAFARGTSGVQRMDRTVEDIARTLDPLEAVTMATVKTISDVRKQRVATTVLDLLESAGVPWLKTVQVNPNLPLKANQFKQIRGGVTRVYEVAPEYDDFVRAIDGQYQYSQVLLMRMMRGIKRLQTGGVVLEPTFQIYNVTRDTIMSALQRADFSRGLAEAALGAAGGAASGAAMGDEAQDIVTGAAIGGALGMYARPLANTLAAIKNIVRDEDVYKDFLRDGGSTEGFYVRNADDAHALIRRLTKGRGVPNILTLKGWGDVLSLIGSTGEQATRLAAYKEALGAGMSVPDAVMAAQDRTLNFAKRGATPLAKEVASVTPFWNAKMQGWDKLGRMLRNPKTYATGAAMITAPSVALWFENKDNPLYWQRPQWERNLFWLMPTPDGEDFVRIPKPFELGFMFGSSIERLLDYAAQRGVISSAAPVSAEPGTVLWRSLADIASTTGEGTLPVPPAIAIPAQLGSDRDWFRNRRIVTRPDLPAELQAQPETSAAARVAAERLGVSPEKVDFAVRNVTGTLGGEALRVTDMAARAMGLPSSEPSGGLPLLGRIEQRLITQNRGQTESEAAARNRLRDLERTDAGLKELMKAGDRARIAEYIRDNRDALLTIRRLRRPGEAGQKSLVRQLDDLQAMRRRAQQDVRFTPDERKQILARIRLKSAAISDRINAMTPQGTLPSNR